MNARKHPFLERLRRANPWHFLWIAVLTAEVLTALLTVILSLLLWGHISYPILLVGAIDSFVVSLIVTMIVIYFVRRTKELMVLNDLLEEEVKAKFNAENALKESEYKFRSIVNSSPMGMHLYTLGDAGELIFTGSNPASDKILGISSDTLVGKSIEEAFPGLAGTKVPGKYRRSPRTAGPGTRRK